MPAYWIGHAQMIDPDGYRRYAALATGALSRHPHRVLARGGQIEVLEGFDQTPYNRHVVLEFPSLQAAVDCYRSAEYQRAAAIRLAASARCDLMIVEGVMSKNPDLKEGR